MGKKSIALSLGLFILGAGAAQAATGSEEVEAPKTNTTLAEAIMGGKANINFRYRYETVDQTGFTEDATASTVRIKLKYQTGDWRDFFGVIEFDNVSQVGIGDYNSTVNGKTQYPVIADPLITDINQAYIAYKGIADTVLIAGRTALNFNNQRFVGTVGWRQNDQTWDMVGAVNQSIKDLKLTYGYVWNVNRIFGNDHPFGDLGTSTHIVNAEYEGFGFGKLTGYGLFIDLDDAPVYGLSSNTIGARLEGKQDFGDSGAKFIYELEFASQSDAGNNPNSYTANYTLVSAGLSANGLTGKIGYEVLGADNGVAFQTPLATLHKFNGWADKFLSTPGTGLKDTYVAFSWKPEVEGAMKGIKFDTIYHDFSADSGGADYGTEWDLQVSKKISKNYYVALKYADYNADSFATDTKKMWLTIGANF